MIKRYIFTALSATFAITLPALSGFGQDQLFDNGAVVDGAYWNDPGSTNQFLADNFSLESDSRINGLEWIGLYGEFVSDDSFSVDFYVDNGGLPFESQLITIPLNVKRNSTGESLTLGGEEFELFEYSATFDDLILDGGTDYWLSIQNETNGAFWNWGAEVAPGTFAFRFDEEQGWSTFAGTLDFRIIGSAIPEPSMSAVLAAVAFFAVRRRR